jgi:osmotically-inducible protein OsmY
MPRVFICALLLAMATIAVSQVNPGQKPTQPPMGTPPTFPGQTTPETKAPAPGQMSSADIEQQLQASLDKDSVLSGTNIQTRVDDDTITLTGTVHDESQHQRALQLAQASAGSRKIVDKLTIGS